MIRFNSNHIFTNYIKQLLLSINLPTRSSDGWTSAKGQDYYYNKYILNTTRNFRLNSNSYDSYTHEYLGEYLRFYRDFKGIDLMSLYNCFSDRICDNIDFELTKSKYLSGKIEVNLLQPGPILNHKLNISSSKSSTESIANTNNYRLNITGLNSSDYAINTTSNEKLKINSIAANYKIKFNSSDQNYKIYMIPIRLDKAYTIAIDEAFGIEMCCGLYDKKLLENELPGETYAKFNCCKFLAPILYKAPLSSDASIDPTMKQKIKNICKGKESLIKLFLKVPASNKSSIVVLEGDFRNYNDSVFHKVGNSVIKRQSNHTVINFENPEAYSSFKPISKLQLLRLNTGISYPFADRLIEYLIGNAITPDDPILDNIQRVQKVLEVNSDPNNPNKLISFSFDGVWDDKIKALIYSDMQQIIPDNFDANVDLLGYIDRDVERKYFAQDKKTTFTNIDIYPNMYKDSKEIK